MQKHLHQGFLHSKSSIQVFVTDTTLFRWSRDTKRNRMAKEPGDLSFNPSSLKLCVWYICQLLYTIRTCKTKKMVLLCPVQMLEIFKIKTKAEAFQRFLYKLRITRNLTVLTPYRIQILKPSLYVNIIKFKNSVTNDHQLCWAPCYGILLHFQKLGICKKNITTNTKKIINY